MRTVYHCNYYGTDFTVSFSYCRIIVMTRTTGRTKEMEGQTTLCVGGIKRNVMDIHVISVKYRCNNRIIPPYIVSMVSQGLLTEIEGYKHCARILVQVTIYHWLRIGRDGHLDQS